MTSVEKTVVFYSNSAVTVFIFWPPYTNTADVKLKDVIDVQTFKKKKSFHKKLAFTVYELQQKYSDKLT